MHAVSCAPHALYGAGGFYDPQISLAQLIDGSAAEHEIEVVATLYPGEHVDYAPAELDGPDSDFIRSTQAFYAGIARDFRVGAPSLLVRLASVAIWNNLVFLVRGGRLVPLYECCRVPDRDAKGPDLAARAEAARAERTRVCRRNCLFLGSAGSFNYGHWLIDDLAGLAAVDRLAGAGAVTVVSTRFDQPVDRIKEQAYRLICATDRRRCRTMMLDREAVTEFDDLYYVTPVSYHPILKNRSAMRFVRTTCQAVVRDRAERKEAAPKLFVNRAADGWRRIVNAAEVRLVLGAFGYREIVPERMDLLDQWQAFGGATAVVGIMGAGMASTVLCPPGARILYLAPDGWPEAFYWDLARVSGHAYHAAFFEAVDRGQATYKRDFRVDTARLRTLLERS